jgi:hypothetical protein
MEQPMSRRTLIAAALFSLATAKVIWSFELTVAGTKGIEEVNVDAMTGKVVGKEHESDAKEEKEAKDEAGAKHAKPTATKPAPATK